MMKSAVRTETAEEMRPKYRQNWEQESLNSGLLYGEQKSLSLNELKKGFSSFFWLKLKAKKKG